MTSSTTQIIPKITTIATITIFQMSRIANLKGISNGSSNRSSLFNIIIKNKRINNIKIKLCN